MPLSLGGSGVAMVTTPQRSTAMGGGSTLRSPDGDGAALDDAAGRVLARIAASSRQIDELEVQLEAALAAEAGGTLDEAGTKSVRLVRRRLPLLRASRTRDEKKLEGLLAMESPYREVPSPGAN